MANLAVNSAQLIPATNLTRVTGFDADDQPLSLAVTPAASMSPDIAGANEEPRGFFRFPREMRDKIYKVLDGEIERSVCCGYNYWHDLYSIQRAPKGCVADVDKDEEDLYPNLTHQACEHDDEFDRYVIQANVLDPRLRLLNKQFKQEYEDAYEPSNRLKISSSRNPSLLSWHMIKLPLKLRSSTELELDFTANDRRLCPGCVYCAIKVSVDEGQYSSGSLEQLLEQLPDVKSIQINLLMVIGHERRFLGCPEDRLCPGFRDLRHEFPPDIAQVRPSDHYQLPKLARVLVDLRSHFRDPERCLPPKLQLFIHIGRDRDEPFKNKECIATWTSEGGISVNFDAARLCNVEVCRI